LFYFLIFRGITLYIHFFSNILIRISYSWTHLRYYNFSYKIKYVALWLFLQVQVKHPILSLHLLEMKVAFDISIEQCWPVHKYSLTKLFTVCSKRLLYFWWLNSLIFKIDCSNFKAELINIMKIFGFRYNLVLFFIKAIFLLFF
jgi:hypothetical protein